MANITFSEVSGLNNSVFGASQGPIRLFLEQRGESFEQESIINKVFNMGTSTHFGEKLTGMTAMEGFKPVGENGAYPIDGFEEGYSKMLEHETFKDSFSISREMMEDATLMRLQQRPDAFITGYYRTREKYGASMFASALNGSSSMRFGGRSYSTLGADGQNVFSTAHPAKVSGGTQSNSYEDVFSADALGALATVMQNFRGDNDEILDVTPDTILIPNDYVMKKAVFAAIGSEKDPDNANNAFNFQFGNWKVIVWNYLNQFITSGTKPWVLMDSRYNDNAGGAVWLDRTKLEVRSTIDENTDANVWRGRARWSAGFNDWRFAAAGGMSGGSSLGI